MNIYLAGGIFSIGDKFRNDYFYNALTKAFPQASIYDPLQNTEINGVEGKKKFAGSKEIANGDNSRLDNTDILVACIDGDVIPAGTSAEIGRFSEKIARGDKKCIIGICTDNRQMHLTHSLEKDQGGAAALGEQQYSYQNLYVTGLVKQSGYLVSSIEDAIKAINYWVNKNFPQETEQVKAKKKNAKKVVKEQPKEENNEAVDHGKVVYEYISYNNLKEPHYRKRRVYQDGYIEETNK